MIHRPTLIAFLFSCVGAACSNFGTLALPEHAHLDRLSLDAAAELPIVRLTAGVPVIAVRYPGSGVPVGLWVVTAEPGLVECTWDADATSHPRAAIAVVGMRPGAGTAYYTTRDPAFAHRPDPELRDRLQDQKALLQKYRHHLEQTAPGAEQGKGVYERAQARWSHLLELDLATCSEEELQLAELRGSAEGHFQLVIEKPEGSVPPTLPAASGR